MRKNFVVILCLSVLALLAIVAILAPLIAPFAQNDMVHNPFDPPGAGGVLGADSVGRDMLSRMIYGLRYTMVIPLVATSIAAAIGVALAIIGALNRGWIDGVIGRCFDILMSIPGIIFALLVLAIVGVSLTTLVLTMAVLQSTTYYRITRPVAGDLVAMEYVEIARLRGEGLAWNLFREILPNMIPTLLAQFGLGLASATLFISALSFLGVGIQPPAADLGALVRENALALSGGRMTPLFPAFLIAVLCMCINGVVDYLVVRFSDRPEVSN
ncbi:MAG: ABC transporter permease [Rhizobiaceae bacterium]